MDANVDIDSSLNIVVPCERGALGESYGNNSQWGKFAI